MSNELIAVLLTAFFILTSRKLDLTGAIILYYAACIFTDAYTVGYRVDASPELFYLRQSLIDLCAVGLVCYLSQFHKDAISIYLTYAAIISASMILNGLMLLDQLVNAGVFYRMHLAYQSAAQSVDVFFALMGSERARYFIMRLLPFGGR